MTQKTSTFKVTAERTLGRRVTNRPLRLILTQFEGKKKITCEQSRKLSAHKQTQLHCLPSTCCGLPNEQGGLNRNAWLVCGRLQLRISAWPQVIMNHFVIYLSSSRQMQVVSDRPGPFPSTVFTIIIIHELLYHSTESASIHQSTEEVRNMWSYTTIPHRPSCGGVI